MLNILRIFKKNKDVDPCHYGWTFRDEWQGRKHYFQDGGWKLFESQTGGWVLDKTPKFGPGVIGRYPDLAQHNMEEILALVNLDTEPTRVRSRF